MVVEHGARLDVYYIDGIITKRVENCNCRLEDWHLYERIPF